MKSLTITSTRLRAIGVPPSLKHGKCRQRAEGIVKMAFDRREQSAMIKFAGIALGIVIGGVVAPIAFNGIGLSDPASATVGCLAGAVCGYAMVRAVLLIERCRRDRELRQAAEAVRDEHGLPPSIHVRVKNAHFLLDGVVE